MSEQSPKKIESQSDKWSGGLIAGAVILTLFIPIIVVLISYIIVSITLYNKRQKRLAEIEEAKNYLFTELK